MVGAWQAAVLRPGFPGGDTAQEPPLQVVLRWVLSQLGDTVSSQALSTTMRSSRGWELEIAGLARWSEAGDAMEVLGSHLLCCFWSWKNNSVTFTLKCLSFQPCQTFYQICHETVGRFIQYGILTVAEVRGQALPVLAFSLSFLSAALTSHSTSYIVKSRWVEEKNNNGENKHWDCLISRFLWCNRCCLKRILTWFRDTQKSAFWDEIRTWVCLQLAHMQFSFLRLCFNFGRFKGCGLGK